MGITFGSDEAKEQIQTDKQFQVNKKRQQKRDNLLGKISARENSPFVEYVIETKDLFVTGSEMADFVSELHEADGKENMGWIFEFLKNFIANMEDLDNETLHKIAAVLFENKKV